PRGAQDCFIAGAAAEIALKRLLDLRVGRFRITHPERIERHHETRSAEAALRAVEINHGLLDGVQFAVVSTQMLDRHHMAAIERAETSDARIDAFVDQFAVEKPSDQHRAGAAIPFGAALLGTAQRPPQAQEIQERFLRPAFGEREWLVIEQEADFAADRHHQLPLYVEYP